MCHCHNRQREEQYHGTVRRRHSPHRIHLHARSVRTHHDSARCQRNPWSGHPHQPRMTVSLVKQHRDTAKRIRSLRHPSSQSYILNTGKGSARRQYNIWPPTRSNQHRPLLLSHWRNTSKLGKTKRQHGLATRWQLLLGNISSFDCRVSTTCFPNGRFQSSANQTEGVCAQISPTPAL